MAMSNPDRIEDIQARMQDLSLRVIDEIMDMLDTASPAIRQRLLIGMYAKLLPIITTTKDQGPEEMRLVLEDMFAKMRPGSAFDIAPQDDVEADEET